MEGRIAAHKYQFQIFSAENGSSMLRPYALQSIHDKIHLGPHQFSKSTLRYLVNPKSKTVLPGFVGSVSDQVEVALALGRRARAQADQNPQQHGAPVQADAEDQRGDGRQICEGAAGSGDMSHSHCLRRPSCTGLRRLRRKQLVVTSFEAA